MAAAGLSTPAAAEAKPPPTPAELEEQSFALAMRLQQEEERAFEQAMHANSPAVQQPQRAPEPGTPMDQGAEGVEDESLMLAMRLQQEELQWQRQQAGGGGGEELDEATLAAIRAAQEGE